MKNPHYIYAKAFRGYKALAAQGNVDGQRYLGMMYENGQGVPKNYVEAVRWYEKAAAQGDPAAMVRLGLLLANARGAPRNYVEACKLFQLALDRGFEDAAKLLDQVKSKMTDEETARACKLAEEWTPAS